MTKREILQQIQRQINEANKELQKTLQSLKGVSDMVEEIIIRDN